MERAHALQSDVNGESGSMHRCASCGKFCSFRALAQGSSLCLHCSASWQGLETPRSDAQEHARSSSQDPAPIVAYEFSPSPESSVIIDTSTVDDAGEKVIEEDASQQEIGLCSRCWAAEGTSVLYNSPVCDECFREAKEKREPIKGTKKRYQPPTPCLQPGKRLTRVCDTCRRKRKRCQHRRIVDENHSEADPRPRSSKRREPRSTVTLLNSPSPPSTEADSKSQVGTTPEKPCRSSPRRQSARRARHRIGSMVEVCMSPPSSLSSLLEVVNSELEKESSPRTEEPQSDHSAVETAPDNRGNLKLAIQESVNIVHAREMARVVSDIQEKMADINDTVQALKLKINGWMKTSYGGSGA